MATSAGIAPSIRPAEATYYASGSNHPGEIRGFAELGHPIGVSALQLSERALTLLGQVRVPLFVDSGAFGETAGRAFDSARWERVLDVYERLARVGVRVVAPDKVGDQIETLARLRRHRWRLLWLRALGAELIVPLQRGPLGLVELYDRVVELLGDEDFVVGLPGNRAALDEEDLLPLLRARTPRALHVLGMGPANRRAPSFVAFLAEHAPEAELSMDSNLRLAHLGEGRRLTLAEGEAQDQLVKAERCGHPGLPDYTDAIGFPNDWASKAERARVAQVAVPRGKRASFVRDPEAHLDEHCREEPVGAWCWELEAELERAWSRYWARATVEERKAEGIRRAFGGAR